MTGSTMVFGFGSVWLFAPAGRRYRERSMTTRFGRGDLAISAIKPHARPWIHRCAVASTSDRLTAFRFQGVDDPAQRLDHLTALHLLFTKLQDELKFLGGRDIAESVTARPLLGVALFPRLLPVHHPQREPPDQVTHLGFL